MSDQVPPSPGVGARRRPKNVPQLPRSAFSPPNSSADDKFPLPPSPGSLQPETVVDGSVSLKKNSDLAAWKAAAGEALGPKISGVVLSLDGPDAIESIPADPALPVLSVILPLPKGNLPEINAKVPIAYYAPFTGPAPEVVEAAKAALKNGHVVELDVRTNLRVDTGWEAVEEFIGAALDGERHPTKEPIIVVSNILPPPHGLEVPAVKLLTNPTYLSYGSHSATMSFFPSVYIKFLPPAWDAPTPKSPTIAATSIVSEEERRELDSDEKKEWKRRTRMYLGPIVEAFGFNRIIFGTSPSASVVSASNAGDWYQLAREVVAELGVDQEGIDAVFGGNARHVYGAAS